MACRTSNAVCDSITSTFSPGPESAAVSGRTKTLVPTKETVSCWQQVIEQLAIRLPPECSHSIGASALGLAFFWWVPELCFCAAHIMPLQQAIPRELHAIAASGAHNIATASRHTHAAMILPGAIGVVRLLFMERATRIPHTAVGRHSSPLCIVRSFQILEATSRSCAIVAFSSSPLVDI